MGLNKEENPDILALKSLTEEQVRFLQALPKAELHAHLNGSIPLPCLQALAKERSQSISQSLPEHVVAGLEILSKGFELYNLNDFFDLFPAIYALTSTPKALSFATRNVLIHFLEPTSSGSPAQCAYIELRSTPRITQKMSRRQYIEAVLDEVEKYPADKAGLLVSIDRRMSIEDLTECVDLSISLRAEGRRILGVDLCGDPLASRLSPDI